MLHWLLNIHHIWLALHIQVGGNPNIQLACSACCRATRICGVQITRKARENCSEISTKNQRILIGQGVGTLPKVGQTPHTKKYLRVARFLPARPVCRNLEMHCAAPRGIWRLLVCKISILATRTAGCFRK